jgi:diaminopropionate ammonia-lyase
MRDIISEFSETDSGYIQSERSGYSIGIGFPSDWAENEFQISPHSEAVFQEGMTLHLIPWIQIPEIGSIGFSDTVLVTKYGATSLFNSESSSNYEYSLRYTLKGYDWTTYVTTKEILSYMSENMDDAIAFHKDHEHCEPTDLVVRSDIEGINNLYVKDEFGRMGLKAFKISGVSYAMHKLEKEGVLRPGMTITTMTDGNHGSAVSYVAKQMGYKAIIFVPQNMTQERRDTIESHGAEIRLVKGGYDDSIAMVRRAVIENNWILISDTAWTGYEEIPKDIATGYCTIFDEVQKNIIENNLPPPTHIFFQVGVGGFAAGGIAYAVERMNPRPKLICVEPDDADCMYENVISDCHDGTMACRGDTDSIMSGLNCGVPSTTAWPLIRDFCSAFVVIGDGWARKAVRKLYHTDHENQRVMSGESGAAGLAGLLACLESPDLMRELELDSDSNVLVINTEGVTDKSTFNEIIGYNVCK